jgi:hypothetical protein
MKGLNTSLQLSQHMKEKPASTSLRHTESPWAILGLESLLVNGLTEHCTKLGMTSEHEAKPSIKGVSNENTRGLFSGGHQVLECLNAIEKRLVGASQTRKLVWDQHQKAHYCRVDGVHRKGGCACVG